MLKHVISFTLFLSLPLSAHSSSANCPLDGEDCPQQQLLHSFKLPDDFELDNSGAECADPSIQSYVNNNVNKGNIATDQNGIKLISTYTGVDPGSCKNNKKKTFQTGRLQSKQSINSYFKNKNPYTGYIEFVAKMPKCNLSDPRACDGFWPGLWLLFFPPVGKKDLYLPEFDILEMNYWSPDPASMHKYSSAVIFKDILRGGNEGRVFRQVGIPIQDNPTENFLTYGMRWICTDKPNFSCTYNFTFKGTDKKTHLKQTVMVYFDPACPTPTDTETRNPPVASPDKVLKFCTRKPGFYNAFALENTIRVMLSLHVGNFSKNQANSYKFPKSPTEIGNLTVSQINLYQ